MCRFVVLITILSGPYKRAVRIEWVNPKASVLLAIVLPAASPNSNLRSAIGGSHKTPVGAAYAHPSESRGVLHLLTALLREPAAFSLCFCCVFFLRCSQSIVGIGIAWRWIRMKSVLWMQRALLFVTEYLVPPER